MKVILCMIPILPDLRHIRFENNQISDEYGPLILFSAFMHPKVTKLTFIRNYLKSSFTNTLYELMRQFPKRLEMINLTTSIVQSECFDVFTYTEIRREGNAHLGLPQQAKLKELNFSNCPLSNTACKNLGALLIYSSNLKILDISNCKLQNQTTRSIIEGLNRNNAL